MSNYKMLLLFFTIFIHFSTKINSMKNEENNIIIINSNESNLEEAEYKPFDPDFLYNKDFLDNPEALKIAKKEAITLRLQQKYTESLPYLEEAIKHGDLQSMIWLGEYYEQKGDILKAIQWYILAFQLHWLDTFKHHPNILKKFKAIEKQYTILKYNNKRKTKIVLEFNNSFYELPISDIDKKEIKQFLYEFVIPDPALYKFIMADPHNFLKFYPTDLNESEFDNYLNSIDTCITENKDTLKFQHIKKIFQKTRQTLYQKKIKIYSNSDDTITLESKNYISALHHILGSQYFQNDILNIDGTANYTKAAEHYLLSQDDTDIHLVLCHLYLDKNANFQAILNNPEKNKCHKRIKDLIQELSIQENIDYYYEEMKNKLLTKSNNISIIATILALYHFNNIGKKLNKNEKDEIIFHFKNKALNIFNQSIPHKNNYALMGYIYYFASDYKNARTNFLLAIENKVNIDTEIIDLIDTHIQVEENLKILEQENNRIEDISQSTSSIINNLDTYEEFSTHLSEDEFSTKNLPSDIITKSFKKDISTKESKRLLKINKLNYKIKKDYEKIEKYKKQFEEKHKKYGVFLDKNISTQEFKKRKILFSSEKKPLTNKQIQIKEKYEQLIGENPKFQRLIEDIKNNPWSGGEGQVEHLKSRGSYSRRINHCDRLEYRINSDGDIVILAVEGHYND